MSNLFSHLSASAKRFPDNIFIIDKGDEWTYREIYEKVVHLANNLSGCNINCGDRIIIYLYNSVEYIIAFYAVLLVNGIIVPINKNTSDDDLQHIISETGPKAIISASNGSRRFERNVSLGSCNLLDVDKILDRVEFIETEHGNKIENYDLCVDDQTAMIIYTSGTTKAPKGVMLTHLNLISNTESILKYLNLTDQDSALVTIPLSNAYGNSLLLTHTKAGGYLVIENRASYPIKVLEELQSGKVTGFSTVGSYLNILLKQEYIKNIDLSNLKYMTFAGESTSYEDIVRLNRIVPHLKIYVMYGQTEASARLSYLQPDMVFKKPGSIGKGIPGVKLRVVSEDGNDVCPGEIGEIIASGDNIMKGYWNSPEDTMSVLKDGWLYTGDLATVDNEGYVYIKGRKKDIIKYLGHRISPIEIETIINTCDGVLESAVVETENGNVKQIKAYVVLRNKEICEETIYSHLRRALPSFKRPHIIEFTNVIPRTLNGKIKRSVLRDENICNKNSI